MGQGPCCAFQSQAPQEVIDAANRLARTYEQAWNAHDAAKIASLFTEDATYVSAGGESAAGRRQIQQLVGQEHQGPLRQSTVTITVRSVRALSPDLVIADSHTTVSGAQAGAMPPSLHVTTIGEKVGGQWRIRALRAFPAPGMGPPQGVGGAGDAGAPPRPPRRH
jgi:uncharacterized protein (TIGR02246 family)